MSSGGFRGLIVPGEHQNRKGHIKWHLLCMYAIFDTFTFHNFEHCQQKKAVADLIIDLNNGILNPCCL